jgi:hypothetical protein
MKKERLPNAAVERFCQMLAHDRRYQENCAKRVMAGQADHLLTTALQEEHSPRKRSRPARGSRLQLEYAYYDAHPEAVAGIEDEATRAMVERYLIRRAAARADVDPPADVARSRIPELDQFLRPGLPRERFLRRWRAGTVTRSLESRIRRIADAADASEGTSPKVLRIVFRGDLHDPMARPRTTAAEPRGPSPDSTTPAAGHPRPGDPPGRIVKIDGEEYVEMMDG